MATMWMWRCAGAFLGFSMVVPCFFIWNGMGSTSNLEGDCY